MRSSLLASLLTVSAILLIAALRTHDVSPPEPNEGSRRESQIVSTSDKIAPTSAALSDTESSSIKVEPQKAQQDSADAAFKSWLKTYQVTVPALPQLLAEGERLVKERAQWMSQQMRQNPDEAVSAALTRAERATLPASVAVQVEEFVSMRGDYAVMAGVPRRGRKESFSRTEVRLPGGVIYEATPVKALRSMTTKENVPLAGLKLGEQMVVQSEVARVMEWSETRLSTLPVRAPKRFLHQEETSLTQPEVMVEAAGELTPVCCRSHAQQVAKAYMQEAYGGQPVVGGVAPAIPAANTRGTKSQLVILTDFSDAVGRPGDEFGPFTDDYVTEVVGTDSGSFYADISYGKMSLSDPTITNVLRMPNTLRSYAQSSSGAALMKQHAEAAARAAGHEPNNFDHVTMIFASAADIPSSQIVVAGLADVGGKFIWMNGYLTMPVFTHELGHNLGLRHANLWSKATVSSDPIDPAGAEMEYGDELDFMGATSELVNGNVAYPSPWTANRLAWLENANVSAVNATGTFRVYRYDHPTPDTTKTLALRIPRRDGQDYWLGFRRSYLGDTIFDTWGTGATLIWSEESDGTSQLLDMTPTSPSPPGRLRDDNGTFDIADGALQVGQTFTDTQEGITITVTGTGGVAEVDRYLDVSVTIQPRVRFVAQKVSVNEASGTATLQVTRMSNSSGAVSVAYTTVAGTATAGADYTTTTGSLQWADGETGIKTITVPVIADSVTEGMHQFIVRLTGATGAVISSGTDATVHLLEAGNQDPSWAHSFMTSSAEDLLVEADGSMNLTGYFSAQSNGILSSGITRLLPNGSAQPGYDHGPGLSAIEGRALALQPDGALLLAGNFSQIHGTTRNRVARLKPDGSLDTSFDPGVGPNGVIRTLAVQPDGRIWVGGDFTTWNGSPRACLVRLLPNGSLDTSVGDFDNIVDLLSTVRAIKLQPVSAAPHYAVLVAGQFYRNVAGAKCSGVIRLNATDGTHDSSFVPSVGAHSAGNVNQLQTVSALAVQADGKVLVGGFFTGFNGVNATRMARLNADGSNDSSFITAMGAGLSGGAVSYVSKLALQADGKILVGGFFTAASGAAHTGLVRYQSTGARDSSFTGSIGSGSGLLCMALHSDNFLVTGNNSAGEGTTVLRRFATGQSALPGTIAFRSTTAAGMEGGVVTLQVDRTGGSAGSAVVNYQISENSATSTDYGLTQGQLSWAAGDTSTKEIQVPLSVDGLAEGNETFRVNLVATAGSAHLAASSAEVTISDLGGGAPVVNFAAATSSVAENSGSHSISISLSAPAVADITVPLTLQGTASSSSDFSGIPASITFNMGDSNKTLVLTLNDDTDVEGSESIILRLGSPEGSPAGLGAISTHTVTLTDNDSHFAPIFTTVPPSTVARLASSVTFTAATSASPAATYRWKKGTTVLAGQTAATLTLTNMASTAAGTYTVEATNSQGTTARSFELVLTDAITRSVELNVGKNQIFSITAYGTAGRFSYEWLKDGLAIPAVPTDFTGITTKTLTILGAATTDSGVYACKVTATGTTPGSTPGPAQTLNVIDAVPVILDPGVAPDGNLPDAIVGGSYTPLQIQTDGLANHRATKFTQIGLPAGLSISTSGVISGKPVVALTAEKPYSVKIYATNGLGSSFITKTLRLKPQPAIGRWVGIIQRDASVNANLGGYMDITTTSNGYYTGKVVLGTRTISIAATQLSTASVGSAVVTGGKSITTTPTGSFAFSLNNDTMLCTGSVTIGAATATLSGFKAAWSATQPANDFKFAHSFKLSLPSNQVGQAGIPQGHGFGTFTVAAAGTATVTWRLPDMSLFTSSIVLGSSGQFMIYQLIGTNGSVFGMPSIDRSTGAITGTLSWLRGVQVASSRFYQPGFSAFDLAVEGQRFVVPLGQNVLGVAEATGNAQIVFTQAGIETASRYPATNITFKLKNNNLLDLTGVSNPAATTCVIVPTTGAFSGKTSLLDSGVPRTVNYYGAVVRDPATGKGTGYGVFQLTGIPLATGQTLAGMVTLTPQ